MNARNGGGDTGKGPLRSDIVFRIPGFELTGGSAEPEEDAMFVGFLGRSQCVGTSKEPVPAHHRCETGGSHSLKEEAAMDRMIGPGASSP